MNTDNPEVNAKVEAWDTYNSTPYASYISLPDWLGWTEGQYDFWLKTGEVPEDG